MIMCVRNIDILCVSINFVCKYFMIYFVQVLWVAISVNYLTRVEVCYCASVMWQDEFSGG